MYEKIICQKNTQSMDESYKVLPIAFFEELSELTFKYSSTCSHESESIAFLRISKVNL